MRGSSGCTARSRGPTRRTLTQARGHLNLARDLEPEALEVLSTDFTELRYAGGDRKAWLIGFIDLDSAWIPGRATGPSANRERRHSAVGSQPPLAYLESQGITA